MNHKGLNVKPGKFLCPLSSKSWTRPRNIRKTFDKVVNADAEARLNNRVPVNMKKQLIDTSDGIKCQTDLSLSAKPCLGKPRDRMFILFQTMAVFSVERRCTLRITLGFMTRSRSRSAFFVNRLALSLVILPQSRGGHIATSQSIKTNVVPKFTNLGPPRYANSRPMQWPVTVHPVHQLLQRIRHLAGLRHLKLMS